MAEKIRIGILGYGNLGKGVELAIRQNPDMELAAFFTRRAPEALKTQSPDVPVYNVKDAISKKDDIDVMILCGGSATDLPVQSPEYAKYLEERNAEYNRRHTARRKEQMEALRARAEAGDQEAKSQLAERKQYQVRATVKSYRKMREDALNGDPIAKERYEKTLAMRREAYHAKKSEQTA